MSQNTAISNYFKSIRKIPLLTKQQEIELAKRIEKGDNLAKKKMIESNLRLAISVAKKYSKYGGSLEDLIQESNLGLIKAVEKFDWRKGYKFSTYASWWIKQAATRHLTANGSLLKIPSHTIANASKIWKLMKDYQEEFNCDPSISEISTILSIPEKHVEQAIASIKAKNLKSIDQPVGDENGRTLGEIIPDQGPSIETLLDQESIRNQIINSFKSLTKREELILRLRFGITEIDESYITEKGE